MSGTKLIQVVGAFIRNKEKYREFKIIDKHTPVVLKLEELRTTILSSKKDREKAEKEVSLIFSRIRGKLDEEVTEQCAVTTMKVLAAVSTLIWLLKPTASVPLVILNLCFVVGTIALFMYNKQPKTKGALEGLSLPEAFVNKKLTLSQWTSKNGYLVGKDANERMASLLSEVEAITGAKLTKDEAKKIVLRVINPHLVNWGPDSSYIEEQCQYVYQRRLSDEQKPLFKYLIDATGQKIVL